MKNKSLRVLSDFVPGMIITPANKSHVSFGKNFQVSRFVDGRVVCGNLSVFAPGELKFAVYIHTPGDYLSTPLSRWKAALRSSVVRFIFEARRQGTVGMSLDNLFQCIKLPQTGGPATPAAARALFGQVVRDLESRPIVSQFIIR